MAITEALTANLSALLSDSQISRIGIAYSGGVDSHVLLHALVTQVKAKLELKQPLIAYHIDHQLQADSDKWREHCQNVCQALAIEFKHVSVDANPERRESPEAKARDARYSALAELMQTNELILTAQHQDDQAETLLLQLMRGAGVHGLAAMPKVKAFAKGYLARPLIDCTREQILSYAEQHQLNWIEDPSNQDTQVPRNFIRQNVLPLLKQHWPNAQQQIAQSAEHLQQQLVIEQHYNQLLLAECVLDTNSHFSRLTGPALDLKQLAKHSLAIQHTLIRHWLAEQGVARVGKQQLDIISQEIIGARDDAKPQLKHQGFVITRYQQALYLVPEILMAPSVESETIELKVDVYQLLESVTNNKVELELPNSPFKLVVEQVAGQGVVLDHSIAQLQVRARKQGDKALVAGKAHQRSIKKLFNEYQVPYWLRDTWPVISIIDNANQSTIIACPALFICEGYQANQDQLGLVFGLELSDGGRSA